MNSSQQSKTKSSKHIPLSQQSTDQTSSNTTPTTTTTTSTTTRVIPGQTSKVVSSSNPQPTTYTSGRNSRHTALQTAQPQSLPPSRNNSKTLANSKNQNDSTTTTTTTTPRQSTVTSTKLNKKNNNNNKLSPISLITPPTTTQQTTSSTTDSTPSSPTISPRASINKPLVSNTNNNTTTTKSKSSPRRAPRAFSSVNNGDNEKPSSQPASPNTDDDNDSNFFDDNRNDEDDLFAILGTSYQPISIPTTPTTTSQSSTSKSSSQLNITRHKPQPISTKSHSIIKTVQPQSTITTQSSTITKSQSTSSTSITTTQPSTPTTTKSKSLRSRRFHRNDNIDDGDNSDNFQTNLNETIDLSSSFNENDAKSFQTTTKSQQHSQQLQSNKINSKMVDSNESDIEVVVTKKSSKITMNGNDSNDVDDHDLFDQSDDDNSSTTFKKNHSKLSKTSKNNHKNNKSNDVDSSAQKFTRHTHRKSSSKSGVASSIKVEKYIKLLTDLPYLTTYYRHLLIYAFLKKSPNQLPFATKHFHNLRHLFEKVEIMNQEQHQQIFNSHFNLQNGIMDLSHLKNITSSNDDGGKTAFYEGPIDTIGLDLAYYIHQFPAPTTLKSFSKTQLPLPTTTTTTNSSTTSTNSSTTTTRLSTLLSLDNEPVLLHTNSHDDNYILPSIQLKSKSLSPTSSSLSPIPSVTTTSSTTPPFLLSTMLQKSTIVWPTYRQTLQQLSHYDSRLVQSNLITIYTELFRKLGMLPDLDGNYVVHPYWTQVIRYYNYNCLLANRPIYLPGYTNATLNSNQQNQIDNHLLLTSLTSAPSPLSTHNSPLTTSQPTPIPSKVKKMKKIIVQEMQQRQVRTFAPGLRLPTKENPLSLREAIMWCREYFCLEFFHQFEKNTKTPELKQQQSTTSTTTPQITLSSKRITPLQVPKSLSHGKQQYWLKISQFFLKLINEPYGIGLQDCWRDSYAPNAFNVDYHHLIPHGFLSASSSATSNMVLNQPMFPSDPHLTQLKNEFFAVYEFAMLSWSRWLLHDAIKIIMFFTQPCERSVELSTHYHNLQIELQCSDEHLFAPHKLKSDETTTTTKSDEAPSPKPDEELYSTRSNSKKRKLFLGMGDNDDDNGGNDNANQQDGDDGNNDDKNNNNSNDDLVASLTKTKLLIGSSNNNSNMNDDDDDDEDLGENRGRGKTLKRSISKSNPIIKDVNENITTTSAVSNSSPSPLSRSNSNSSENDPNNDDSNNSTTTTTKSSKSKRHKNNVQSPPQPQSPQHNDDTQASPVLLSSAAPIPTQSTKKYKPDFTGIAIPHSIPVVPNPKENIHGIYALRGIACHFWTQSTPSRTTDATPKGQLLNKIKAFQVKNKITGLALAEPTYPSNVTTPPTSLDKLYDPTTPDIILGPNSTEADIFAQFYQSQIKENPKFTPGRFFKDFAQYLSFVARWDGWPEKFNNPLLGQKYDSVCFIIPYVFQHEIARCPGFLELIFIPYCLYLHCFTKHSKDAVKSTNLTDWIRNQVVLDSILDSFHGDDINEAVEWQLPEHWIQTCALYTTENVLVDVEKEVEDDDDNDKDLIMGDDDDNNNNIIQPSTITTANVDFNQPMIISTDSTAPLSTTSLPSNVSIKSDLSKLIRSNPIPIGFDEKLKSAAVHRLPSQAGDDRQLYNLSFKPEILPSPYDVKHFTVLNGASTLMNDGDDDQEPRPIPTLPKSAQLSMNDLLKSQAHINPHYLAYAMTQDDTKQILTHISHSLYFFLRFFFPWVEANIAFLDIEPVDNMCGLSLEMVQENFDALEAMFRIQSQYPTMTPKEQNKLEENEDISLQMHDYVTGEQISKPTHIDIFEFFNITHTTIIHDVRYPTFPLLFSFIQYLQAYLALTEIHTKRDLNYPALDQYIKSLVYDDFNPWSNVFDDRDDPIVNMLYNNPSFITNIVNKNHGTPKKVSRFKNSRMSSYTTEYSDDDENNNNDDIDDKKSTRGKISKTGISSIDLASDDDDGDGITSSIGKLASTGDSDQDLQNFYSQLDQQVQKYYNKTFLADEDDKECFIYELYQKKILSRSLVETFKSLFYVIGDISVNCCDNFFHGFYVVNKTRLDKYEEASQSYSNELEVHRTNLEALVRTNPFIRFKSSVSDFQTQLDLYVKSKLSEREMDRIKTELGQPVVPLQESTIEEFISTLSPSRLNEFESTIDSQFQSLPVIELPDQCPTKPTYPQLFIYIPTSLDSLWKVNSFVAPPSITMFNRSTVNSNQIYSLSNIMSEFRKFYFNLALRVKDGKSIKPADTMLIQDWCAIFSPTMSSRIKKKIDGETYSQSSSYQSIDCLTQIVPLYLSNILSLQQCPTTISANRLNSKLQTSGSVDRLSRHPCANQHGLYVNGWALRLADIQLLTMKYQFPGLINHGLIAHGSFSRHSSLTQSQYYTLDADYNIKSPLSPRSDFTFSAPNASFQLVMLDYHGDATCYHNDDIEHNWTFGLTSSPPKYIANTRDAKSYQTQYQKEFEMFINSLSSTSSLSRYPILGQRLSELHYLPGEQQPAVDLDAEHFGSCARFANHYHCLGKQSAEFTHYISTDPNAFQNTYFPQHHEIGSLFPHLSTTNTIATQPDALRFRNTVGIALTSDLTPAKEFLITYGKEYTKKLVGCFRGQFQDCFPGIGLHSGHIKLHQLYSNGGYQTISKWAGNRSIQFP